MLPSGLQKGQIAWRVHLRQNGGAIHIRGHQAMAPHPQRPFDIVHACRLLKTRHAFAAKKFMDGGVTLVKRIVEGDHGSGRIDSGKGARGQRVRSQEMQPPWNQVRHFSLSTACSRRNSRLCKRP